MAVYVFRDGRMVDKNTGEPMVDGDGPLCTPRVFGDYPAYQSPIDGSLVDGKRARRYDMEKHGCIDANDFQPPGFKRKFKNRKFTEKRGLTDLLADDAK